MPVLEEAMVDWLVCGFVLALEQAVASVLVRIVFAFLVSVGRLFACLRACLREAVVESCSEIENRTPVYIGDGSADCCSESQEQEQEQSKVNGGASLR